MGKNNGLPLPKFESRSLKYGYSNARARAMRGILLSPSALDELIKVKTLNGMVELLQRTRYKDGLTELSIKYSGTRLIEIATQRKFIQTARKILKMAPETDKGIIKALLRKWDLRMLRMIVNARRAGKKFDDIRPYIMPLSQEYAKSFEAIASAEDVFGAFRKTPLGREVMETELPITQTLLQKFRQAMQKGDVLMQLQLTLEAYTYAYLNTALMSSGSKDVERIAETLRKELDARNVITIEKMKKKGAGRDEIMQYMIKGGRLSQRTLESIIESKGMEDTQRIVQAHIGKIEMAGQELIDLEIALDRMLAFDKVKAFHRSILSIGTLLGAVLILEEEVHNIRKIAKAKEFGLSEEETLRTLVIT